MGKTKVSICCVTFNQDVLLSTTLYGFEIQETDFPLEIIIYDDCSTDTTRQLLTEYKQKSKYAVHLILAKENKFSKGEKIFPKAIAKASGNYVALCEGDDYWTDPKKLQKQVDFLENHQECSFCFHKAEKLYQKKNEFGSSYPNGINNKIIEPEDFFKIPTIPTASVVFRNRPNITFLKHSHGDFQLYCQLLTTGNAGFLNENMSVYRIHSHGVSTGYGSKQYLVNRINELLIEKSISTYSVEVRQQIKKIIAEHMLHFLLKYRGDITFAQKIQCIKFLILNDTFYSFSFLKKMSIFKTLIQ